MDYHADRFTDASLLFYDDKSRLLGLLPANIDSVTKTVWSHQGLTYGGLLLADDVHYAAVAEMMDAACGYFREMGFHNVVYKCIPHIYARYPSEEDLYWLFRSHATLMTRSLSSCINLGNALSFSVLRKRKFNKARRLGLSVSMSEEWAEYWEILSQVLTTRHGVSPVHTREEMLLLHSRFPTQIVLYTVTDATDMLGGCVVYDTGGVAHIQYIAATDAGREAGALDFLFHHIIQIYKDKGSRYLDFGVSTEDGGRCLNEGLLFQKEGLGGRAVVYDSYQITL